MCFDELQGEQLLAISGGCGFCTVGSVVGTASTAAGLALVFTASGPILIGTAIVGAGIGYLMTK